MDKVIVFTGNPPKLTRQESKTLDVLRYHAGNLVSKTELLRQVHEAAGRDVVTPHSNVMEVVVMRLRRKLAAAGANATIESMRLSGYRLVITDAEPPQA